MATERNIIRLTHSMRRQSLPQLPGQPEQTSYGIVSNGLDMPRDGLCYVVRFEEPSSAQILAYVDEYGRIFETSQPERIPPARYPAMAILNYSDEEGAGCVNIIDANGTGHRVAEVRRELAGYRLLNARVCMPDLPKTDLQGTCAIAYLAFRHFPHINGNDTAVMHLADVLRTLRDNLPIEAFRIIVEQSRTARSIVGARPLALVEYLAATLEQTGLAETEPEVLGLGEDAYPANTIRLAKLKAYSGSFYLDFDRETAGASATEALLNAESALNRFAELCRWAEETDQVETLAPEQCGEADRWLCDRVCAQAPDPAEAEAGAGEWDTRLELARRIENLRLPFRTDCAFRMDLGNGALAMDVLCPSSEFMPRIAIAAGTPVLNPQETLNSDEARFAAHAAILYAACGFSANAALGHALVNVYRRTPDGERECVITMHCARDAFQRAFDGDAEHLFADPFKTLADMGATLRFGEGFRLERVQALGSIHDERFCPPGKFGPIEECEGKFDAECARILGVERVCDLNIFEDRKRQGLAERILTALGQGRQRALAEVKDIHDRTENVMVRNVCDRVAKGIESGEIDAHSYLELHEAFSDLYGLKALQMRASALIESDPDAAQALFEETLRAAEAGRWFEDSPAVCHRFFESYASRVLMAKRAPEETRTILPLADDVFFARDRLAYLLCDSFDAGTLGLKYAEEAMASAPTQASGHAHAARIYYFTGDFISEIEECKAMLKVGIKKPDLALAYYWMGFAYWKTGKPEVGAICYRRAMELDREYGAMAFEELEDLLSQNKSLRTMERSEEDAKLAAEGIPFDAARENAQFLIEMAKGAADAGSFVLAQILLASAIPHVRDDALYPLFQSLEP